MVSWIENRPVTLTLLGALAVGAFGVASIHSGVPSRFSPLSASVTIVAMLLTDWLTTHVTSGPMHHVILYFLAVAPVTLAFVAWSHFLFSGQGATPRRSLVLFIILAALSTIDLSSGWRYGLKYHGLVHTIIVVGYNLLAVGCFFYRANRRSLRFSLNLTFHAGLFSWLAWCAFPWLGELP